MKGTAMRLALLMLLATLAGAMTACAPPGSDANSHTAKQQPYVDSGAASGGGGGY